ncbi:hypothetical protein QZH41_000779 [Actinostola sp. cb2023]|nr:hypothetical protein QZH41_000779 [Actinostola sp. cb2023]
MIDESPYYRPPETKDLDPRMLRKLLGKDYNPNYTAMTEQEVHRRRKEEFLRNLKNNDSPEHQVYRKFLVHSMPQRIKDLDFTMPGLRRNLGPRASRKLQLWLWKMSSCPVFSKWKYFGKRYWPPYRNVGRCGKKPSCSFPRGMKCKKAATKKVVALGWICFKNLTVTCRWIKIDLAVITKCQCTCAHSKTTDN